MFHVQDREKLERIIRGQLDLRGTWPGRLQEMKDTLAALVDRTAREHPSRVLTEWMAQEPGIPRFFPAEGEGLRPDFYSPDELVGPEGPVLGLVTRVFAELMGSGVEEAILTAREATMELQVRRGGKLSIWMQIPKAAQDALTQRFKQLSCLDPDETRLPQDGKIRTRCRDGSERRLFEFRMSTFPTFFGERIQIRGCEPTRFPRTFDQAGIDPGLRERLVSAVTGRPGVTLITGLEGSGRLATLYALLTDSALKGWDRVSAESESPSFLEEVTQMTPRPCLGLTMAACLRTFLRQEPDLIAVEIEDEESARLAFEAGRQGHRIITRLTAGSVVEALGRLQDLGISRHDLAHTLKLVHCQRRPSPGGPKDCIPPMILDQLVVEGANSQAIERGDSFDSIASQPA